MGIVYWRFYVATAVRARRNNSAQAPAGPAVAPLKPKRLAATVFSLMVFAVLLAAWAHRNDNWISPQDGLGYWLGIAGSVMMVLLLLYPLRKAYRALDWLGKVGDIFRIHMVMGIVGPVLVLLHCNFQLGSINSNVALGAMLVVVFSGIVGRFLYGHIHVGLYGRKAELKEFIGDAQALKLILGRDVEEAPALQESLRAYEIEAMQSASPLNALRFGGATRRGRKLLSAEIMAMIERQSIASHWTPVVKAARTDAALLHLEQYLSAIRRAAAFAVYERLFAIWHVLHMPMFFLLVFAAIVHIVAVHLY